MSVESRGRGGGKYSEAVHEEIVAAIRAGRPKSIAAAMVGVHADTLWAWLNNARERPDEYPEYVAVLKDMEDARAAWAGEALDRIEAAAKADSKNWVADALAP